MTLARAHAQHKTTYGGDPDEWRNGKAPNFSCLPANVPVAWAELERNGWKFPKPPAESAAMAALIGPLACCGDELQSPQYSVLKFEPMKSLQRCCGHFRSGHCSKPMSA